MGRLLILVGIVLAVLWFLHWFRRTPSQKVARTLRKAALFGVVALVLFAVATGRLNPVFAALGALVPLLIRVLNLVQMFPALQRLARSLGLGLPAGLGGGAASAGGAQASSIRTRYLEMRLDHETGAMDGTVLDGPFQGRRLGELEMGELLRLVEFYRESDAQSAAVLETFLDREHGEGWRERHGAGSGPAAATDDRLTEAEAWAILGLEPGADEEAIRAAHRRLMQRFHPDRGGSDYLAAKINAAKRLLLGH
jgi:hypothetical protein